MHWIWSKTYLRTEFEDLWRNYIWRVVWIWHANPTRLGLSSIILNQIVSTVIVRIGRINFARTILRDIIANETICPNNRVLVGVVSFMILFFYLSCSFIRGIAIHWLKRFPRSTLCLRCLIRIRFGIHNAILLSDIHHGFLFVTAHIIPLVTIQGIVKLILLKVDEWIVSYMVRSNSSIKIGRLINLSYLLFNWRWLGNCWLCNLRTIV
jgi:hypothetical protein